MYTQINRDLEAAGQAPVHARQRKWRCQNFKNEDAPAVISFWNSTLCGTCLDKGVVSRFFGVYYGTHKIKILSSL